jgi:tRNA G18 (ribose-2'-O)-methylase SpoU
MDRVPFQATAAGASYDEVRTIPVAVLLDNVRSLYNVGAFFRTADAAAIEKLHLCGITGRPPKRAITKTALGAEETHVHAVDLFDWRPRFPVCMIFGHEVDGIQPVLSAMCDTHVRIPMLGTKHSLNVATAGGIVIYELLRKYRALASEAGHQKPNL